MLRFSASKYRVPVIFSSDFHIVLRRAHLKRCFEYKQCGRQIQEVLMWRDMRANSALFPLGTHSSVLYNGCRGGKVVLRAGGS